MEKGAADEAASFSFLGEKRGTGRALVDKPDRPGYNKIT